MGVEDHLLRLARIGPHIHHPAVAEPDMRNLHGRRHTAQNNNLVAPVELVSFARCVIKWYIGFRRYGPTLFQPRACITPDRIIATRVTQIA
ncbi:hypothetical protein Brsp07_00690 [Brucella sp. NBRC 14130]